MYDGAILFKNNRAECDFLWACRDQGFNVNEHLLHGRGSYVNYEDRVMVEQLGDGRLSLWIHEDDAYVHLHGDAVIAPHWDIPIAEGLEGKVVVKDLLIAGDHNAVRTIRRRFKATMRGLHNSSDYKRGIATGLTANDWEWIVGDLRDTNATVLVVTSEGLVIQVHHNRMEWLRPSNSLLSRKYPQLLEAAYVKHLTGAWVKSGIFTYRQVSKFTDSVNYIGLTVGNEHRR